MPIEEWTVAIGKVPTLDALGDLSRSLWKDLADGRLREPEVEALSGAIERRRVALKARQGLREAVARKAAQGPSLWAYARREDRSRSILRRRRLAASGPLPPALASNFTTGELAVLRIVGDEVRVKGTCDRTIGELAARAGVGRTTVQNALRYASAIGLLLNRQRRRPYQRSLPNVVTIVSAEWKTWLVRRPRQTLDQEALEGGFKEPNPTVTKTSKEGCRKEGAPPLVCRMPLEGSQTGPGEARGSSGLPPYIRKMSPLQEHPMVFDTSRRGRDKRSA